MDHRTRVGVVREFLNVPEFETGKLMVGSFFASLAVATAAAATGLGFMAWRATGILLLALLVLMSAVIFTDYYNYEDKRNYPWNKAIARKVMIVTLVVISLVLDVVIYQISTYFPQEFVLLDSGYLFITMTTCIWLIAAELLCILKNIEDSGAEDTIPPTLHILARHLKWVLSSMKFIDRSRAGAERMEEVEKDPKRWYDEITDEEVEQLAAFLQGQREDPPEPVKPAADMEVEERPLNNEVNPPEEET